MSATELSFLAPGNFPEIQPGDDLADLIASALAGDGLDLQDGDLVVVAQKIVSKAEGRLQRLEEVEPSSRARELALICQKDPRVIELVLRESRSVLRCVPGIIVVEDVRGFVMANAGIDSSNVVAQGGAETVLLLPVDPDASAARLQWALCRRYDAEIGVVINDSFGRAWRKGTVGTALGVAGMPGLLDLRGSPDRQGRKLQSTELGVADEVAAGASLIMGQAREGRPVVRVRGFPYHLRSGAGSELIRPARQDLFR